MGLLTYIIAKWRKVLLPICKRSFVWMWPIKLNVRSTWQAERGRRTKKTAMLLIGHGAGRMSPVQTEQEHADKADRHMDSKKMDAAACCGMLQNPHVQLQKMGAAACCGMLRLHMLACQCATGAQERLKAE